MSIADEPLHEPARQYCVLHLGMPKTASTVLQNELFLRHSEVHYLGKYHAEPRTGGFPDPEVRKFTEALAKSNFDPAPHRHLQPLLIEPAWRRGRIPVWSKENLTEGSIARHVERARMFRDIFGQCRVVIFLRHPVSFAESMYFQGLRAVYLHKINASDRKRSRARARFYKGIGLRTWFFDIEQWLDANWRQPGKGQLGHLRPLDTAEGYAEVFGRENVRFFVFEDFVSDPRKVVTNLCGFMGIDATEGLALISGKRWNERWTVRQIERLKAIDRSPWQRLGLRLLPERFGRHALGLDELKQWSMDSQARAEVPAIWRERILEWTRDQNERLMRDWGLALDRFGYGGSEPRIVPAPRRTAANGV